MIVARKAVRDQRRGLIGWGIGIVVLVGTMAALWPTVRGFTNLEDLIAGYPEGFRRLFDLDALGTGAGYLNIELFSIMLPVLFVIYGAGRGARALAGEEEAGTLEMVLATPVSRARVLGEKAIGLVAGVSALGVVLAASTLAASAIMDMGIGVAGAVSGALAMTLLGVEHGLLALAIGAATGHRSMALAGTAVVAAAGYVLFVVGRLVAAVEPWSVISPFHQALSEGPIGSRVAPAAFGWMALAGVAAVLASERRFRMRDLAVG